MKIGLLVSGMFLTAFLAVSCVTERYADGSSTTSILGIPVSSTDAEGNTFLSPLIEEALPAPLRLFLALRAGEALLTPRGRRNLGVLCKPGTPVKNRVGALGALTINSGSPPEAQPKEKAS